MSRVCNNCGHYSPTHLTCPRKVNGLCPNSSFWVDTNYQQLNQTQNSNDINLEFGYLIKPIKFILLFSIYAPFLVSPFIIGAMGISIYENLFDVNIGSFDPNGPDSKTSYKDIISVSAVLINSVYLIAIYIFINKGLQYYFKLAFSSILASSFVMFLFLILSRNVIPDSEKDLFVVSLYSLVFALWNIVGAIIFFRLRNNNGNIL